MKKELYPWQEDCLKKWFANNGRGMVQAVTGSGKTLLALTAAHRLKNTLPRELRVKIVVPSGALMRQWFRALNEFLVYTEGSDGHPGGLRQEIGLRGAGSKSPVDRRYMIYVINSARYELARQILSDLKNGSAVLLIADECHRYESEQNRLIFEFLPYIEQYEGCFFSLGLSATLPRGNAQDFLASVLGKKIYSFGMQQAIAANTVCKYDIFHIGLSFLPDEDEKYQEITERMSHIYAGLLRRYPMLKGLSVKELFEQLRILSGSKDRKTADAASIYTRLSYKRKSLVCLASSRISCACELIKRLPKTEKILIFGERIRQADELYALLQNQYPERVGRYHSQMGTQANRNVLERFRNGSIRILIACRAIDEGLDVPDADIGIILSGTSVQRQRIQRLGRVIRNAKGKEGASLYYLHLVDTAEDACFLPDPGEARLFELVYRSETREFVHPVYDRAAGALLDRLRLSGASAGVLEETVRCLNLGCVRPDWRFNRDELKRKADGAKNTGERNYWICMKKMSELCGSEKQPFLQKNERI